MLIFALIFRAQSSIASNELNLTYGRLSPSCSSLCLHMHTIRDMKYTSNANTPNQIFILWYAGIGNNLFNKNSANTKFILSNFNRIRSKIKQTPKRQKLLNLTYIFPSFLHQQTKFLDERLKSINKIAQCVIMISFRIYICVCMCMAKAKEKRKESSAYSIWTKLTKVTKPFSIGFSPAMNICYYSLNGNRSTN